MSQISDLVAELKQKRDELELQIHLGSQEAKQEWEELEAKWTDFFEKAKLEESAEGVGSAVNLLSEELKQGYERLKKAL